MTTREEVWIKAWTAVALSPRVCINSNTDMANGCLRDFDRAFPESLETPYNDNSK